MGRMVICLAALVLASSASLAQGPSERRVTCERGPIATRTYGGTAWHIYGCNDDRSVAVVTAPGNPGLPFYFMFSESNGQYWLSGEGTGRPDITRKAYEELVRLSQQDIRALVKETLSLPRPGQ